MILKTWIADQTKTFSDIFTGLDVSFLNQMSSDDENAISHILKEKYSDLVFDESIESWADFQETILDCLKSHKWNINRLWELYSTEYEPLENYNRIETVTDIYGEKTTTTNLGEQTSTSTSGAQTSTSTNSIYPYDNTESTETDGSQTVAGARTDSGTTSARTDSNVEGSHTDSHTNNTHGNIGVMSSQQMFEQEYGLLTKHMNYYEQIALMLVTDICLPIFE